MNFKSKTAKLAAGLVGFAFAFSLVVAPTAKAQTNSELQAMINTLLAQIASLQGQIGGTTGSTSHTFTMDLTVGSTGSEVVALQQMLVAKGFLTMPAGVAMGYFGEATRSAVAAWQAANGITPASGYFGPITRAKVNSMVVVTPGNPSNPSNPSNGQAGDVTVTSRSSGTDNQVIEGSSNTKVLGFDVKAQGSDVNVTSVRVEMEHTDSDTASSDRLTRYADSVAIMYNGKVVGSADASEFSKDSNVYSRNIAVSGASVSEDQTGRFYVVVSALDNLDSNDAGTDWEVALGQVRFTDGTGAILTDTTGTGIGGSITQTFTFEDLATSGDVKLTVNEDDSSVNDAHTVQVDDTSDTNDVDILSFTLKADNSDIHLKEIPFDITSVGAGVTEIANDFHLMMDGQDVGTVTIDTGNSFASSTNTTRTVTVTNLDDDDVVISSGDEVSFTLTADLNDTGGAFGNGDYLGVTLNSDSIDAEDQNGDSVSTADLTGTADSANISFSASGIMLSTGGSDSSSVLVNSSNVTTDDQGKFTINFDVTAFEDTAWIALSAASSTSATPSTAGAEVFVESPNSDDVSVAGVSGNTTATTTATLELASGQSNFADGNYAKIGAGQTVHLVATVYFDPATTGVFRGQLYAINFATTKAAGTTQQLALPTSDYQSPSESVQN